MTKAISFGKVRIHCDECHHEFEGSPPDWNNKPCPKCDQGNLISNEELRLWKFMRKAAGIANFIIGDVPEDAPMQRVEFHVKSSGVEITNAAKGQIPDDDGSSHDRNGRKTTH